MKQQIADELTQAVGEAAPRLRKIDEGTAAFRVQPGKWSVKEIIGHLIDSATNNHQRFIRAQQTHEFAFPGYVQDEWVRSQGYQDRPWLELIDLWALYNRHLSHVIQRIPESALEAKCRIGTGEPVTLAFLIEDYLGHLHHHLAQIEERISAQ